MVQWNFSGLRIRKVGLNPNQYFIIIIILYLFTGERIFITISNNWPLKNAFTFDIETNFIPIDGLIKG